MNANYDDVCQGRSHALLPDGLWQVPCFVCLTACAGEGSTVCAEVPCCRGVHASWTRMQLLWTGAATGNRAMSGWHQAQGQQVEDRVCRYTTFRPIRANVRPWCPPP